MDSKDLVKIALEMKNVLFNREITKAEIIMTKGLLEDMITQALINSPIELPKLTPIEALEIKQVKPAVVKPTPTGVSYNEGDYDSPPAMNIDRLPPPQDVTGKIIAKAGQACICKGCNSVVYTLMRDLPDNCKVSYFLESFKPFIDSISELTNKIQIKNIDGNISIDCPVCGGNKTLFLVGKSTPTDGVATGGPTDGVASI